LILAVTVMVAGAGEAQLSLEPTVAAKKAIRRRRKLKVTVRITFAPTGGTPASQEIVVTFKKSKRAAKR